MRQSPLFVAAAFALSLGAGACGRETADTRAEDTIDQAAMDAQRETERMKVRTDEITRLDERIAEIDRDYQARAASTPRGTSGRATAGLREEVQEDVANVRKAVADLRTTTPENWWDRHEAAMKTTADDIEEDVRRFVGARAMPAPRAENRAESPASPDAAAFMSRRDRFVNEYDAKIEAWKESLDKVKVRAAREAELDDLKARVEKFDDDVERLRSASADDWWDLTKQRVSEYIDRVESSVARLDKAQ